ncbi:MAG TPA: glutathione S-transferase family protein [Gaiellaceae bacterium]|nr:glutathione S-transferase family protein [Gaiellaceae bacterium]
MRLHYLPGSAAMAPHAALAEIGVPYELVPVEREADGRSSAEYLALNPWGKVPTLEDGDFVLTESAAICLHLAERFPDARLAPPVGTRERSELYRWLIWLSNTVQTAQLRYFYPDRYGTDGVKEAAEAELYQHHALIEAHLAGREWLLGDERTVADLFLFMLTRWGRFLDPAAWDRPCIRAHWLRTLALPGVTRAIQEQGLELPAFADPALLSADTKRRS